MTANRSILKKAAVTRNARIRRDADISRKDQDRGDPWLEMIAADQEPGSTIFGWAKE